MSDRRVGLDIGSPGTASTGTGTAGSQAREEPDQGLANMFREKLAGGETPAGTAQGQPQMRPFDLFAHAAPAPDPGQAATERRAQVIEETVSRMLVSDASRGGTAEVRVRIRDDLLPGTEVRVSEQAGRLEVHFVATDPASVTWLAAQAESIAGEISRRLRRDVRVSVKREGEDAEHVADGSGNASDSLPGGPASLFANRPIADDDEGKREGEP